jgi:hypothetical protein
VVVGDDLGHLGGPVLVGVTGQQVLAVEFFAALEERDQ